MVYHVIYVQVSREILELLNASTAKEQSIVEKFRSRGRAQVQEFCDHGTKEECVRSGDTPLPCTKLHFRSVLLSILFFVFMSPHMMKKNLSVTSQLQQIFN